jgi:hypothetical protein
VSDGVSVSAAERIALRRFGYFTDHEYVQCERCGMSLSRAERETHICAEHDRQRQKR